MKKNLISCVMVSAILLTACGTSEEMTTINTEPGTETISPTNAPTEVIIENPKPDKESRRITEQSFSINLLPIGDVEFDSYRPDISENKTADVTFELTKDGNLLTTLEGMEELNNRSGLIFQNVEAVSFSDYNNDSYQDILIICNYKKDVDSNQAENAIKEEEYSEARIYSGSSEGTFTLEKQLTEDTNSAIAKLSIDSILGFLNVGYSGTDVVSTDWKEAYAIAIQNDPNKDYVRGYHLIYVNDDEIPELVLVGADEAEGCRIMNYFEGQVYETQLSRLSFTYIEKQNLLCNSEGHMGYYYDDVYTIDNGKFVLLGSGTYENPGDFEANYDENGYLVPDDTFTFTWNGEVCSKEEYKQKFEAVYDVSKAKFGYDNDNSVSVEELMIK